MTAKELVEHLDRDPNIKLYFYNPECKHCKELAPVVKDMTDLVKVNTYNEDEEVSDMFEVEFVPTMAIVKETAEGLDYDLYEGPDEIKEFLL